VVYLPANRPLQITAIVYCLLLHVVTSCAAAEPDSPGSKTIKCSSPSGLYVLNVSSDDFVGRLSGTYKVTHASKPAWSAMLPFMLCSAQITDSGTVVGYAYTRGLMGGADGPGELVLAIVDGRGTLLLNKMIKREESTYLHFAPTPVVLGLIVDEPNDRLILRTADPDFKQRSEWWSMYQLSTGKSNGSIRPCLKVGDVDWKWRLVDTRTFASNELILLHWLVARQRGNIHNLGACFSLIDPKGEQIWVFECPANGEAIETAALPQRQRLIMDPGALRIRNTNCFEVCSPIDNASFVFSMTRALGGKWSIAAESR
jgi:hypothetical protein